jgi:hypothetical protein
MMNDYVNSCLERQAARLGIAVSLLSAFAIWRASPRKVRAVAGQMHKAHIGSAAG